MAKRTPSPIALTAAQARRAIYIDFEGFKGRSPALLGILVEDDFVQVVLDPRLAPAAYAKGLALDDGETVLAGLVRRARRENRLICAFSEHELQVAKHHFGIDLTPRYVNARHVAKRWWNRTHSHIRPPNGWTQRFFEEQLGLERPRHLRSGNATSRLGQVIGQCKRRGDYARLTPTAKAKWTKLLRYNELDVRNLAAIVRATPFVPDRRAA